jgi:hypothetical protein
MRECSGLKKLPEALTKLRSLTRVTCDENMERQWRSIKVSGPCLISQMKYVESKNKKGGLVVLV